MRTNDRTTKEQNNKTQNNITIIKFNFRKLMTCSVSYGYEVMGLYGCAEVTIGLCTPP